MLNVHDYFSGFRIQSIEHTDRLKNADRIVEELAKRIIWQLEQPESFDRSSIITQLFIAVSPELSELSSCSIAFNSLDRARTLCGEADNETIVKYLLQALYMIKLDINLKAIEARQ